MINIYVHNISASDSQNPVITERYQDGCTVRNFTFTNAVGETRDEITVRLFDYSAKARREREDMTYSWGSQR